MKKKIAIILVLIVCVFVFASCDMNTSAGSAKLDQMATMEIADNLSGN